ncbi:MAG TPA: hypothetical protein VD766_03910 [Solirubrobacterales bacterium]|nr:hypothetical protein [Solirubrobacterales bacterium]
MLRDTGDVVPDAVESEQRERGAVGLVLHVTRVPALPVRVKMAGRD